MSKKSEVRGQRVWGEQCASMSKRPYLNCREGTIRPLTLHYAPCFVPSFCLYATGDSIKVMYLFLRNSQQQNTSKNTKAAKVTARRSIEFRVWMCHVMPADSYARFCSFAYRVISTTLGKSRWYEATTVLCVTSYSVITHLILAYQAIPRTVVFIPYLSNTYKTSTSTVLNRVLSKSGVASDQNSIVSAFHQTMLTANRTSVRVRK